MKRVFFSLVAAITAFAAFALLAGSVAAQCVPDPGSPDAYRVYYHNSGLGQNCIQDYDLDFPELLNFITSYQEAPNYGPPIIADHFYGCTIPEKPHGEIVEGYFRFAYGSFPIELESEGFLTWEDMILYLAANYGRGSVVNLSNGTLQWTQSTTQAVLAAYNAEVLLVGAPLTFAAGPVSIGNKVLQCYYMDGRGVYCAQPGFPVPNVAAVGVPTNWITDGEYRIAINAPGEGPGASWQEHGSFSTPLLSGTVQYIADIVASRGLPQGEYIPKVLDYVISACDRNVDPLSYEHRTGETLPSFGPWSEDHGYGIFSAWKALLYAYGYGTLQARDRELHPSQANPATVFSDHFYLRGDLFVPDEQIFRVTKLASVAVDPTASTPEGPLPLGHYADLQEIRVAGSMEIESSYLNPVTGKFGINTSLTVDDGGICAVESGGLITIGAGQILHVYDGGTLEIDSAGVVLIEEGGTLILDTGGTILVEGGGNLVNYGQFDLAGTLTMSSGALLLFGGTGTALLSADLVIPAGASFMTSAGTVVTVASVDAGATGNDTARVEIICHGNINLLGSSLASSEFVGQASGAGQWVGVFIDHAATTGSAVQYAHISDAVTALDINHGSGSLLLTNIDIHSCTTGIRVIERAGLAIQGTADHGSITNCSEGMRIHCDVDIDHMKMHNNGVGLWITGSYPVLEQGVFPHVRDCDIYANYHGVFMADSFANCDLGTEADPGNNDFGGPYPYQMNTYNIWAIDPMWDIFAQYNWWGSKKQAIIEQRIKVWWGHYQSWCIYEPFLVVPPASVSLDPRAEEATPVVPAAAYLEQNRPNPFNPTTRISFGLNEPGRVQLMVYDVSGRLVRALADEQFAAGQHDRVWDGKDANGMSVASGVYFYRLSTKGFSQTKKMVLLR